MKIKVGKRYKIRYPGDCEHALYEGEGICIKECSDGLFVFKELRPELDDLCLATYSYIDIIKEVKPRKKKK